MVVASTNVRHTGAMAADLQSASIQVLTDAAAVGDVLVAVLFVADLSVTTGTADASAFTLPAGWSVVSLESMVATGDPRRLSGAVLVAQKTVTVAGTDASVFKWACVQWRPSKMYKTWCQLTDGSLIVTHMQHTASLTTMRFTGVRGVLGVSSSRLANQLVSYPGYQFPYTITGHAIVLGAIKQAKAQGTLLPAQFHTQRALFGPLKFGGLDIPQTGVTSLMLSTRDFTGVSTLSQFSGTAVGDGFGSTVIVADVLKPQVAFMAPTPGSAVDMSQPFEVSWTPPDAGTQTHWSIYRENPPGSGSNIQFWTGSAWSGSGVWVASSAQSATLGGFAATNGTAYRYLIQTRTDQAQDSSDYGVLDLLHRARPAAPTITLAPAPVAGQVASKVPTMSVSGATTDGGPIVGWEREWRRVDDGTLLASTTISGSWALTTALPNLTQVKARARFSQAGGSQWSPWAETTVTINVPKPAAPAGVFSTVTNPVSGLPLPAFTVTAAAGLTVRVERGGVLVGEVVSAGPSIKVVDLGSPSGPQTWTITTLSAVAFAERSLPTTINGSVVSDGGWIYDPTRPETAVLARVRTMDAREVDLRSAVFDPLGEAFSIVQPGVPAAPRSGMELSHGDPAVIDAAELLMQSGVPLVMRGWPEQGEVDSRQPDITFRPVGKLSRDRLTQGPFGWRILSVGYVAAPPVSAGLGIIT